MAWIFSFLNQIGAYVSDTSPQVPSGAIPEGKPVALPEAVGSLLSSASAHGWKVIPAATFIAAFLFWRYLALIGRPDLFLPSISNATGLGAFLVGFLFLCAVIVFGIAAPSFFFITIYSGIGNDLSPKAEESIPKSLIGVAGAILLALAVAVTYPKSPWLVPTALLIGIIVSICLITFRDSGIKGFWLFFGDKNVPVLRRLTRIAIYLLLMVAGGFLSTLPAILVFSINPISSDEWWAAPTFVILGAAGTALTLLPALTYFYAKSGQAPWKRRAGAVAITVGMLAYLFFFVWAPSAASKLMESAATEIGIRVPTPYTYQLNTEKLAIENIDQRKWGYRKLESSQLVTAIVPLILGELILLCPEHLDTTDKLQKDSAGSCLVLKQSDVVRLPMSSKESE
jgi:hypothetical protein